MTEKRLLTYRRYFNVMQSKHNIVDPILLRKITALGREAEMALYKKDYDLTLSKLAEIVTIYGGETAIRDCEFNYRIDEDIQKIDEKIASKYNECIEKLRNGLLDESISEVYEICNRMKGLLGSEKSKPEVPAVYFNRQAKDVNIERIRNLYDEMSLNVDFPYIQNYCTGRLPNSNDVEMYLRTGCEMVNMAFAGIDNANISEEKRNSLIEQTQKGLDGLLTVQYESGVFPFPDMRKVNPWFAPMIERMLDGKDEREYIINGWLVKNFKGDGGLQFDNSICGSILLEGFKRFGNKMYLDAAIKAGEWAMKQDIVMNFNYNAFSVKLLSELYDATSQHRFLDSAIKKVRFGVIPGLCENGRYFDGHNAKTVYHLILLRGLLAVSKTLESINAQMVDIREATKLAIKGLTDEIITKGASNQASCIQCLSLYAELYGISDDVKVAYKKSINSIFYELDEDRSKSSSFKSSGGMGISLSTLPMAIKIEEIINEKG